jgi:hypothetical protein
VDPSARRIRTRAFLAATLALLVSGASASAATPQTPSLSVLASASTLLVPGSQGNDSATGYFSLLNSGHRPVHIAVTFQAASSEKVAVEAVAPTTVAPGNAQRVGVTFSGLQGLDAAVTGQLVVTGGASPVAQAVEVDPAPPSAAWPASLIAGSLFLALMLAVAVVGAMPGGNRAPLRNPAPGPKWTFSSWATTLTTVGTVLTVVLASTSLPPFPQQIIKPTLINLNILFGALAVLGPFLSQALRRRVLSEDEQDAGRTATNLTLLIACTFTLWAVLGQLSAAAILAWELIGGGTLGWLVVVAFAVVGVLAVRYFFLSTSDLVVRVWPLPAPATPPAPPTPPNQLDVRRFDRLDLQTAFPVVTLTEGREADSAVLAITPVTTQATTHWSLL